jgi:hypothetical protein
VKGQTIGEERFSLERGAALKGAHKAKEKGAPSKGGANSKVAGSKEKGHKSQEGHALQGRTICQACEELAIVIRFFLCIYFAVLILLRLHNKYSSQTGFPRGDFSKVMLTKNTCQICGLHSFISALKV